MSTGSSRPEPVLDEAAVAGRVSAAATAVFGLAVVVGLVTAEEVAPLTAAVTGIAAGVVTIVNFVVPRWRAARARQRVTPLSDPQTADGRPLVPGR